MRVLLRPVADSLNTYRVDDILNFGGHRYRVADIGHGSVADLGTGTAEAAGFREGDRFSPVEKLRRWWHNAFRLPLEADAWVYTLEPLERESNEPLEQEIGGV